MAYDSSIPNDNLDISLIPSAIRQKGIDIIAGNVASATKLATARTIALTGDVTGSVAFDGSGNVSMTATVVDDSHNHIISNVDGLQTVLDGKLGSTANAVSATKLNTARTIAGVSFNGTTDIAIPYANLTGLPTVPDNYDSAHSFGTNGYQKLSNGLILQWGTCENTVAYSIIVFPIAFPNKCCSVSNTWGFDAYPGGLNGCYAYETTNTQFRVTFFNAAYKRVCWFAIGY